MKILAFSSLLFSCLLRITITRRKTKKNNYAYKQIKQELFKIAFYNYKKTHPLICNLKTLENKNPFSNLQEQRNSITNFSLNERNRKSRHTFSIQNQHGQCFCNYFAVYILSSTVRLRTGFNISWVRISQKSSRIFIAYIAVSLTA